MSDSYRYPRTIAEIASMRTAQVVAQPAAVNRLPAERPRCSQHGVYMVLRPSERQTYEQLFCGTWYDCPEYWTPIHRCGSSVCLPSRDLCHQTGELYFDGESYHHV